MTLALIAWLVLACAAPTINSRMLEVSERFEDARRLVGGSDFKAAGDELRAIEEAFADPIVAKHFRDPRYKELRRGLVEGLAAVQAAIDERSRSRSEAELDKTFDRCEACHREF